MSKGVWGLRVYLLSTPIPCPCLHPTHVALDLGLGLDVQDALDCTLWLLTMHVDSPAVRHAHAPLRQTTKK
jgi:hypothetical protein